VVLTVGNGKLALNRDVPLPKPKPTKDNELLESILVFRTVSGGVTTLIVALTAGAVVLIKLTGARSTGDGLVATASAPDDVEDVINKPRSTV